MELLTLAQVREQLWKKGVPDGTSDFPSNYADASESNIMAWNARLNRVVERFFTLMNPARCYRRIDVPIYHSQITLPRDVRSLLQITLLNEEECPCSPLFIYSRFHQFAQCCPECSGCHPVQPLSENAQTFLDPSGEFRLRVTSTQANGQYELFGGKDANGDEYFDSVTLAITNGSTTTSRVYTTLPRMLKMETNVACEVYSVDNSNVATLIAVHAPAETSPAYQRYAVPCNQEGWAARVLTRLCYVKLRADTDIVIPSNYGALGLGLQALRYEDVNDDERAATHWDNALQLIDSDKQMLEGEAEVPVFRGMRGYGCSDMASNGWPYGYVGGGFVYWNGYGH